MRLDGWTVYSATSNLNILNNINITIHLLQWSFKLLALQIDFTDLILALSSL